MIGAGASVDVIFRSVSIFFCGSRRKRPNPSLSQLIGMEQFLSRMRDLFEKGSIVSRGNTPNDGDEADAQAANQRRATTAGVVAEGAEPTGLTGQASQGLLARLPEARRDELLQLEDHSSLFPTPADDANPLSKAKSRATVGGVVSFGGGAGGGTAGADGAASTAPERPGAPTDDLECAVPAPRVTFRTSRLEASQSTSLASSPGRRRDGSQVVTKVRAYDDEGASGGAPRGLVARPSRSASASPSRAQSATQLAQPQQHQQHQQPGGLPQGAYRGIATGRKSASSQASQQSTPKPSRKKIYMVGGAEDRGAKLIFRAPVEDPARGPAAAGRGEEQREYFESASGVGVRTTAAATAKARGSSPRPAGWTEAARFSGGVSGSEEEGNDGDRRCAELGEGGAAAVRVPRVMVHANPRLSAAEPHGSVPEQARNASSPPARGEDAARASGEDKRVVASLQTRMRLKFSVDKSEGDRFRRESTTSLALGRSDRPSTSEGARSRPKFEQTRRGTASVALLGGQRATRTGGDGSAGAAAQQARSRPLSELVDAGARRVLLRDDSTDGGQSPRGNGGNAGGNAERGAAARGTAGEEVQAREVVYSEVGAVAFFDDGVRVTAGAPTGLVAKDRRVVLPDSCVDEDLSIAEDCEPTPEDDVDSGRARGTSCSKDSGLPRKESYVAVPVWGSSSSVSRGAGASVSGFSAGRPSTSGGAVHVGASRGGNVAGLAKEPRGGAQRSWGGSSATQGQARPRTALGGVATGALGPNLRDAPRPSTGARPSTGGPGLGGSRTSSTAVLECSRLGPKLSSGPAREPLPRLCQSASLRDICGGNSRGAPGDARVVPGRAGGSTGILSSASSGGGGEKVLPGALVFQNWFYREPSAKRGGR